MLDREVFVCEEEGGYEISSAVGGERRRDRRDGQWTNQIYHVPANFAP